MRIWEYRPALIQSYNKSPKPHEWVEKTLIYTHATHPTYYGCLLLTSRPHVRTKSVHSISHRGGVLSRQHTAVDGFLDQNYRYKLMDTRFSMSIDPIHWTKSPSREQCLGYNTDRFLWLLTSLICFKTLHQNTEISAVPYAQHKSLTSRYFLHTCSVK